MRRRALLSEGRGGRVERDVDDAGGLDGDTCSVSTFERTTRPE
jgi:hypothetical protein